MHLRGLLTALHSPSIARYHTPAIRRWSAALTYPGLVVFGTDEPSESRPVAPSVDEMPRVRIARPTAASTHALSTSRAAARPRPLGLPTALLAEGVLIVNILAWRRLLLQLLLSERRREISDGTIRLFQIRGIGLYFICILAIRLPTT